MGWAIGSQVWRLDVTRSVLPQTGHFEGGVSSLSSIASPLRSGGGLGAVRCAAGRLKVRTFPRALRRMLGSEQRALF